MIRQTYQTLVVYGSTSTCINSYGFSYFSNSGGSFYCSKQGHTCIQIIGSDFSSPDYQYGKKMPYPQPIISTSLSRLTVVSHEAKKEQSNRQKQNS